MPECVLQAYLDQMPRLRAERALEAAGIGALPWMKQGAAQRWYDAQQARLTLVEATATPGRTSFTWNGKPMLGVRHLKEQMGQALGAGLGA